MYRLMVAITISACVLGASSMAAAQTEADWKARVEALDKKVAEQAQKIAILEVAQGASTETMKSQETKQVSEKVSADAAQYSNDFKVVWDDGVWFKSSDKFALHVGGRMLVDFGWFCAPGIERSRPAMGQPQDAITRVPLAIRFADGGEMRSLRLLMEGTLYKYVDFKLEVDFHPEDDWDIARGLGGALGADMVLKDAYIEMTQIPCIGRFRVGHFKEPFSLEQQTDDLFLTFMERSTMNALVPGYSFGLMAHDAILGEPGARRMTWAVGMFRRLTLGNMGIAGSGPVLHPTSDNLDGNPVNSDKGYGVTARVTGLPYYADKGERLLHVGVGYSFRVSNDDDFMRVAVRPESHLIQYPFLDVSITNARNLSVFGAEAALVYGPFSAQMEYTGVSIGNDGPWTPPGANLTTTRADHDVCYNAFYTQVSCFVTPGDRRAYDTEKGAFTRVRPKKNFREDGGWGAVEVAARYSYISMDQQQLATFGVEDPSVGGGRGHQSYASRGEMHDMTLGVNWYLNPNTKVSANYIRSCPVRIDTSSTADIFMMRFQVDF